MSYKYVIGRSGACIHRISEDKIRPLPQSSWRDRDTYRIIAIRGKDQYYRVDRIYDTFAEAQAAAIAEEQQTLDKKLAQVAKAKARLTKLAQLTQDDTY